MVKPIKHLTISCFYPISFILLSSLFVSENMLSRDHWNRTYVQTEFNPNEKSVSIKICIYDYYFMVTSQKNVHAYLRWCDFQFTTDEKICTRLMRIDTEEQEESVSTITKLSHRYKKSILQFSGAFKPATPSSWPWYKKEVIVKMENAYKTLECFNTVAILTVKWFAGNKFKDVKQIRLNGIWRVNGEGDDEISNINYDNLSKSMLKSTGNQSENNRVKVVAKADVIAITGVGVGENIKVYNLAGVEIQSTVANCDVVNIKLRENQIYFVTVGQAHYKVAMCVP